MRTLPLLLAALFLTACSSGTGTLELRITDAPPEMDISRVDVTLSAIQVHMADAGNESGWITVVNGPVKYDLMQVQNVTELLGSTELAPGKYTQIRLDVQEAKAVINGQETTLTVPSKTVKLVHEFTIDAGKTTKLTLDFDAAESINPSLIMTPTIKVIAE
jgi:hypothetical protein